MEYKSLAKEILKLVGKDNILDVTHCATRLRFSLKNVNTVDIEAIKSLAGVLDVMQVGNQVQVIIGPSVIELYKVFIGLDDYHGSLNYLGKNNLKKKGIKEVLLAILDVLAGIFSPIVPAIVGGGMLKAVLAVMVLLGVQKTSSNYIIVNFIADSAFYFFPMLIAVSAARKFECNQYLALMLAGVLLHPNFIAMVTKAKPVAFFGLPVTLYNYASTVIPIILVVWFMSYVEKFAEKVSPDVVKAILKPLIIMVITAPVALIVIGPAGGLIGDAIGTGIDRLNSVAGWLVPTVIGITNPILVYFGAHRALSPLESMGFATKGYANIEGPGMLASNIAAAAATLVVSIKSKNEKTKQVASSAAVTALCGITEPALYGVLTKLKKPLIVTMIGGGIGGFYAGISGLVRYSFGAPGLATLPIFIGEYPPNNFLHAIITVIISFVATFIIAWFADFDEESEMSTKEIKEDKKKVEKTNIQGRLISSPVKGKCIPIEEVKDSVFSKKVIGSGIAIVPEDGKFYSPVDGEIVTLLETGHAIGIKSSDGIEILIHIGIDTVKLEGKYFFPQKKQGDYVKKGELLMEVDINAIKKSGFDVTTPIIVLNASPDSKLIHSNSKKVCAGEPLLTLV